MSSAFHDDQTLETLQRETFSYFLFHQVEPTGLTRDYSSPESDISIAATGMALACCAIAAERGFISRAEAARRVIQPIEFLLDAPIGQASDASGYRGFFYHFLDGSGRRARHCELSTIDTALLVAGALMAAAYFERDHPIERRIRRAAEELYRRVDWPWALASGQSLCHGWKPESGFLEWRWEGYSEALFMYLLALGSPTHPLPKSAYLAYVDRYQWQSAYGIDLLYAGPLFIHQLSHCWTDLRGIADEIMRERGLDYFENSRRATELQQRYAEANPLGFDGYGRQAFGFTACTGPGPQRLVVAGVEREFYGYAARGVPDGPDDGTLAPWAAVASLPFLPDAVIPCIEHFSSIRLRARSAHGFQTTFNPTLRDARGRPWSSRFHYGLNQGPVVIMVENYRSGLPWAWMRKNRALRAGLLSAGFEGGWLAHP
jgi:hypothetical protein